jgi:hypothetical protein
MPVFDQLRTAIPAIRSSCFNGTFPQGPSKVRLSELGCSATQSLEYRGTGIRRDRSVSDRHEFVDAQCRHQLLRTGVQSKNDPVDSVVNSETISERLFDLTMTSSVSSSGLPSPRLSKRSDRSSERSRLHSWTFTIRPNCCAAFLMPPAIQSVCLEATRTPPVQ